MLPKGGNCLFDCLLKYIDFIDNSFETRLYICNIMEDICSTKNKNSEINNLYKIIVDEAKKYNLTWKEYITFMKQNKTSGGTLELFIFGITHKRRILVFQKKSNVLIDLLQEIKNNDEYNINEPILINHNNKS